MSTYNIIKLKNITPLHIGKGKNFYDSMFADVLSDSLTAALAAVRANCMGKTDGVEEFMHSFKLSSAFPYYKEEFFLPKPVGRIEIGIDEKYRKKLKKIQYLEKTIFEDIFIRGKSINITKDHLWNNLITKSVLTGEDIPYKNGEVERVTIPRDEASDATPFFFEYRYFSKDAGLYCITDAVGDIFKEVLECFDKLGQEGIGSDKNVGGGHFEVEAGTIDIEDTTSNDYLLLSMFIPTQEEMGNIDLEKSAYQLLLRGGYMAGNCEESHRHYLKKAIYMMQSSSCIHSVQPPHGKIVNLRNEFSGHDIYRNGEAFIIPIKIRNSNE